MKKILTESYIKLASDFKTQPGTFPSGNYTMHDVFMNQKNMKPKCKKCRRKGLDEDNRYTTEKVYQHGTDAPVIETRTTGML